MHCIWIWRKTYNATMLLLHKMSNVQGLMWPKTSGCCSCSVALSSSSMPSAAASSSSASSKEASGFRSVVWSAQSSSQHSSRPLCWCSFQSTATMLQAITAAKTRPLGARKCFGCLSSWSSSGSSRAAQALRSTRTISSVSSVKECTLMINLWTNQNNPKSNLMGNQRDSQANDSRKLMPIESCLTYQTNKMRHNRQLLADVRHRVKSSSSVAKRAELIWSVSGKCFHSSKDNNYVYCFSFNDPSKLRLTVSISAMHQCMCSIKVKSWLRFCLT